MKENRFFRVVRGAIRPLAAVIFPVKAEGLENLPAEGALLLCCNHISLLDPVLVACAMRRPISFIAKRELFKTRLGKWFFEKLGMVSVDRGASDLQAMRVCLGVLNEGGALGIFPQGHRYRNDEKHELQTGAAMMAIRSRATVVTVNISHPLRAFRRTYIRFHRPLDLSDVTRANSEALLEVTHRIASGIWQEEKIHEHQSESV